MLVAIGLAFLAACGGSNAGSIAMSPEQTESSDTPETLTNDDPGVATTGAPASTTTTGISNRGQPSLNFQEALHVEALIDGLRTWFGSAPDVAHQCFALEALSILGWEDLRPFDEVASEIYDSTGEFRLFLPRLFESGRPGADVFYEMPRSDLAAALQQCYTYAEIFAFVGVDTFTDAGVECVSEAFRQATDGNEHRHLVIAFFAIAGIDGYGEGGTEELGVRDAQFGRFQQLVTPCTELRQPAAFDPHAPVREVTLRPSSLGDPIGFLTEALVGSELVPPGSVALEPAEWGDTGLPAVVDANDDFVSFVRFIYDGSTAAWRAHSRLPSRASVCFAFAYSPVDVSQIIPDGCQ
jgi:hypothetical protein